MTPSERASLAEQILTNPLFNAVFTELESSATEALIYATTEQTRAECQMRVQAIRAFRQDCEAAFRNHQPMKGAVA